MIRFPSILIAGFLAATCSMADPVAADEPRIGLVLGGGGAAGVAHVGVIRELERLGIRPDVIAGTSMGAIVGGLYAAGLTPAEIETAVTEIDWSTIFNDASDRQLLHPLRRDSRLDPLSVQADLPIGIGDEGLRADAGLVDAVKLTLMLRRLVVRAEGISDFDTLPIPFRAVATDLVTGEAVVLGEGDLATAIRASMSIPGLFPPVQIGDRLLVDGGVVNNLPVDVARAMGVDFLIVVNIPAAEVTQDDVRGFTGALAQTMSIMIAANAKAQVATLGPGDVLLVPDVGEVGILAFEKAASTVSVGRAAVAAAEAQLRALAAQRTAIAAWPDGRSVEAGSIDYAAIEIVYDGALDPRVIRERLALPERGPVSIEEIETALRRVYGLAVFDSVTYRTEMRGGARTLVVSATPDAASRFDLRFGLGLNDVFGGGGDFGLALGLSATGLNSLGGRIDVDGAIGAIEGVRFRFEQPLDFGQTFFVRPLASYVSQTGTLFVQPDQAVAEIGVEDIDLGVEVLWVPGEWGALGVGIGYSHLTFETETGLIPGLGQPRAVRDEVLLGIFADYDTLDDPDLPSSGFQISGKLDLDVLDGARPSQIEIDAVGAWSFGQNTVSPFVYLSGGIDEDEFTPRFIGGFQRLSGFEQNELIGAVVGVAGLRYYHRFLYDTLFGKEAFLGGSIEYGGAYADWGDVLGDGSFVAGSVFAGIETSFGPLMVGFGTADSGQYSVTFTLGARF